MAPSGCKEIVIADPSLEAAIREQLGVPEGPISQEAALALEVLDSNPTPPIETLNGLQCFSNLKSLRLGSVVSDLGPLESLDSLGALELKSSEVTDLSPLIGAPKLSELDLSDTPLSAVDRDRETVDLDREAERGERPFRVVARLGRLGDGGRAVRVEPGEDDRALDLGARHLRYIGDRAERRAVDRERRVAIDRVDARTHQAERFHHPAHRPSRQRLVADHRRGEQNRQTWLRS